MKNIFIGCMLLLLSVSCTADAGKKVRVIEQKPLPQQLGTYRHLRINTSEGRADVYAVTLNLHYRARLYLQTAQEPRLAQSIDAISKQQNALLAINGNFYNQQFKPAGLLVYRGQLMQHYIPHSVLNSCFIIDADGKITLEVTRAHCIHAPYMALQTGPLLLSHFQIPDSLLNLTYKNAHKSRSFYGPHYRTILAQTRDKQLIVLITTPVSLVQIAHWLKEYPQWLGVNTIETAINLDGGSSTGIYIRFDQQTFYWPEAGRVKTLLLFN